ncbi:uncharacterized protein B0T23DRAFT_146097 [Neurospora hispaniola]|uniref:Uncharacterized protein n=1 Tax=Neurospora hispaniola TaxID=588809 RepID=A0AAJ0MRF7_9PEZI|nr:hypothetical protein B0T23DRAFT_146097 [Neurospora hispaniola]
MIVFLLLHLPSSSTLSSIINIVCFIFSSFILHHPRSHMDFSQHILMMRGGTPCASALGGGAWRPPGWASSNTNTSTLDITNTQHLENTFCGRAFSSLATCWGVQGSLLLGRVFKTHHRRQVALAVQSGRHNRHIQRAVGSGLLGVLLLSLSIWTGHD